MVSRHYRVLVSAACFVLPGLLLIALVDPAQGQGLRRHVAISTVFGTMFGHAILAAAWCALGSGKFIYRLPLSAAWIAMLALALAINLLIYSGPGWRALAIVTCCVSGQWLVAQLPLWFLVRWYGTGLRHVRETALPTTSHSLQFGIRQLMALTAGVAVVLGAGRLVVSHLGNEFSRGEGPIFTFLVLAAVLITLPVLLAAILPRHAIAGTLLTVLFAGLATAAEVPLFRHLHGGTAPDAFTFVALNASTIAWILAAALVTRRNGYALGGSGHTSNASTGLP